MTHQANKHTQIHTHTLTPPRTHPPPHTHTDTPTHPYTPSHPHREKDAYAMQSLCLGQPCNRNLLGKVLSLLDLHVPVSGLQRQNTPLTHAPSAPMHPKAPCPSLQQPGTASTVPDLIGTFYYTSCILYPSPHSRPCHARHTHLSTNLFVQSEA